ncbi:hypothetical protein D3C81_693330 [compost metagenome]
MKTNNLKRGAKMTLACGIIAASLSVGASAFAFTDLKGDPAEAKIQSLYDAGVINGVSNQLFAPKAKVTYGQAIQFLVNGLSLTPAADSDGPAKASDYFTKLDDKSWYAPSFVTAVRSGLSLAPSTDPKAVITRAEFAHLLDQAIQTKGNFPVTKMYAFISDGDKLDAATMNSLQTLFNMRVITFEDDGKFRPDDAVTRAEAAVWIYNARNVIQNTPSVSPGVEESDAAAMVSLEKAADGVNKVTVTVGNLPNPGYGLSIARIEFGSEQKAVIYYEITKPAPGQMYAQVISTAKAVTYLPEGYTATAKPLPGSYTPPATDSPLY